MNENESFIEELSGRYEKVECHDLTGSWEKEYNRTYHLYCGSYFAWMNYIVGKDMYHLQLYFKNKGIPLKHEGPMPEYTRQEVLNYLDMYLPINQEVQMSLF